MDGNIPVSMALEEGPISCTHGDLLFIGMEMGSIQTD